MKVLFVGNSFTARNNVPALIATLAAARGLTLEHRLISAGGASLKMHWNKGLPQQAMAETRHDYVMLQEQSTLPVKNATRMHENIRLFDAPIRESGAQMALYLTWARQYAPETQQQLTDAYRSIGRELGAVVAPAGVAWQRFLAEHTHPVLHDKDGSHPTLAGSYLAACVIYATLFEVSPVGVSMDLPGLTPGDIDALQRTAWETVTLGG